MVSFTGKHSTEKMPGSSLESSRHVVQNVKRLGSHNVGLIEGPENLEVTTQNSGHAVLGRCKSGFCLQED